MSSSWYPPSIAAAVSRWLLTSSTKRRLVVCSISGPTAQTRELLEIRQRLTSSRTVSRPSNPYRYIPKTNAPVADGFEYKPNLGGPVAPATGSQYHGDAPLQRSQGASKAGRIDRPAVRPDRLPRRQLQHGYKILKMIDYLYLFDGSAGGNAADDWRQVFAGAVCDRARRHKS